MVHADTIGAVSWAFSLRRDQLLGRLWQFVDLWARGLRSPANIPGAEYELLHREVVGECGEIFPWLDERISEHGVLHQPKAEGQSQLAAGAGRNLAVHEQDASRRVVFHNQRPKGRPRLPPGPDGTLPSMNTMRPAGRSCFKAWRSTMR